MIHAYLFLFFNLQFFFWNYLQKKKFQRSKLFDSSSPSVVIWVTDFLFYISISVFLCLCFYTFSFFLFLTFGNVDCLCLAYFFKLTCLSVCLSVCLHFVFGLFYCSLIRRLSLCVCRFRLFLSSLFTHLSVCSSVCLSFCLWYFKIFSPLFFFSFFLLSCTKIIICYFVCLPDVVESCCAKKL
jgi:hypothetical protein